MFFVIFLLVGLTWGAFFCPDNGFIYSDQSHCSATCSSCQALLDNPQGLACDTANYEYFVYNPQTNKTIAITKSSGFWDEFQNLLVVEDASDNEAGRVILSYLNVHAWIGLYDPNLSASYNSVNPSRFVWYDGTPVSYTNWHDGEPNNAVLNEDIGVVSPPGEHWGEMYEDGTWNDYGKHYYDPNPVRRALVMWRQQLDCVNGVSENDQTTTQDMVNLYCNGQTPCYLCTDGNDIKACNLGVAFWGSVELSGSGKLSPISLDPPLTGSVKIHASGTIEYCYWDGVGHCPLSGTEALIRRIAFKGSDGKYYWFGNPHACTGNLSFTTLSYTTNSDGSVTIEVPQGVSLVDVADIETYSGECTSDNLFNFSLTFYTGRQEWLCPIQNDCQCPEGGVWDDDLKKCVKDPDYTCSSSFYSFDSTSKLCVSPPLCQGGSYDSADDRCEVSPVPVCPSGSSYDSSLDLCYTSYTCPSGYSLDPNDDRCEMTASVSCRRGTFNQNSGMCEFSPECPPSSTLVNGRCEKAPRTACGTGTYDPSDNRFEWSPSCPVGLINPSKDRCEYSPTCDYGSVGSSGMCETNAEWMCPPGYNYDASSHQCVYVERIPATPSCPAGYSYDDSKKMCVASPEWRCEVEKGGCVDPPQRFSCTGGNCSSGGFNFGTNCEVDPGCGVINPGESCQDGQCSYTNLSVQICPDGSVSSTCEVLPSYSCPDGYTLNLDVCEKVHTETPVPVCPEGYAYDENLGVCVGMPDCGSGQYDVNNRVCWVEVANTGCGNANYDPAQDVCWTTFFFTCDEGYVFDPEKRVCYTSPTCPEGTLVNGVCRIAPDTNCGGHSFDAGQMVCYSAPQCGGLFGYSSARDRCEKPADRSCEVGTYDASQDVCFFSPSCEDGGTFNAGRDRCEMSPQMGCSSPFVLDQDFCVADRICQGMTACVETKSCPSGGTFDAGSGVCYVEATSVCPSGYYYDSGKGACGSLPVELSGSGRLSPVPLNPPLTGTVRIYTSGTIEYCYWNGVGHCPTSGVDALIWRIAFKGSDGKYYGFDPWWACTGNLFLTTLSYTVNSDGSVTVEVPKGISLVETVDIESYSGECTSDNRISFRMNFYVDPVPGCPSGYIYVSSRSRCEAPSDVSMSCPLDPSLPCIQNEDGKYYCSPYQCLDAEQYPPVSEDTQEGSNDIPADGTVDENGCNGTIYVFNGRDMRCRPPGTQTGASDCCKKTKTWFGLGKCKETERQLAALRSWGELEGRCHYVGKYCAEYWGPDCCKVCVQMKKTFCCFTSPLARIIHEQGRPQLGIGWGTPEAPNCRGFTTQEFQKLDFSKIDFSEWIEEEVKAKIAPSVESNISNAVQNIQGQFQR